MHALETINGKTAFADARTDAWHQLGQSGLGKFTAEEAMQFALLGGWEVRKEPIWTEVGGRKIAIPGRAAVVRNNPVIKGQIDVLGDVGEGYRIVQNEEHAELLNALVEESGAAFETAGSMYDGRQVFLTMKLPGHINVGGVDGVENYIAAINSHDGSMAFTFMVTPIRIVCANTLNMAFANHSNIIRIRHTSGLHTGLQTKVREALDLTFDYLDAFSAEAEQMIQTTMTQAKFEAIIEKEFGAPEDASKAAVTRADKKIAELSELFADAHTQEGIRETAWAGFNALTEWADHFSPTRGEERDEARAVKAILDPSFKVRARQLMMAQV